MPSLSNDDDRTLMPDGRNGSEGASAASDFNAMSDADALPPGTVLAEFEIKSLIGVGGFGIVYLAYDRSLDRQVAIKEYMPSWLASRAADGTVVVSARRNTETFSAGLRSFINEARFLAKFDHPSLVKVYRFWEANRTGYMVMPFYKGETLKQALTSKHLRPDEAWLKELLSQLLDALEVLHCAHCFHRDISPDNILLLEDGRPLLLDFGAARRVIGDMTQVLTIMLKPGYAPLEQYAETPSMKQGPWTDLYALAAVVYFAVTGRAPIPSVARAMSDPLEPLAQAGSGRFSNTFLRGIDASLAVKPERRPQSIGEFRRLIGLNGGAGNEGKTLRAERGETLHLRADETDFVDVDLRRLQRRRRWLYGGSFIVLVAISSSLLLLWHPWNTVGVPTASEPSVAATPSAVVDEVPTEQARNATQIAPVPDRMSPQAGPPPARFDPVQILDAIYEGRDLEQQVSVTLDRAELRIKKDNLRFSIRSSRPGYLYVLAVGTKGSDFYLLFPNSEERDNRIAADKPLPVPALLELPAEGPPGTDHFVALVSDHPRDLGILGGRKADVFTQFSVDAAAASYRLRGDRGSLLAGRPICGSQPCSESYGAARFEVVEVAR